MKMRCNLHTHTCFCDGKDTPEQLVQTALRLGFETIGFSGHCLTEFDRSYCMDEEKTRQYRKEIARLQAAYGDQIAIFCGIEQDRYGVQPEQPYAYAIGSVHYVKRNQKYIPVDETADILKTAIQQDYQENPYRLLEDYFRAVVEIGQQTDLVGHLDLVTKFSEQVTLFDERAPRYRELAIAAVEKLIASGHGCFEINTGAMARGYRTTPYPAPWLLCEIQARGGSICITTDCHDRNQLDYGYEQTVNLAIECGFSSQTILTADGWKQVKIKK